MGTAANCDLFSSQLKRAGPCVVAAFLLLCFYFIFPHSSNFAQSPSAAMPQDAKPAPSPTPSTKTNARRLASFATNVLKDQKAIWTSPFRLDGDDAKLLAGFGAVTVGLIATDSRTSAWIKHRGSISTMSEHVSSLGTIFGTGGVAAAFFIAGQAKNDARATETGVLAAQALIDSGIVVGVVKHITQRPKPNLDGGRGQFFRGGMSFPSGHSASAWAVATVIAHEYEDKPLLHFGAYAAAVAVGISRYAGRAHFLSEVLVGSAIGFYTGRYVYRSHHVTTADVDNDNKPPRGEVTKLMPTILPMYDARTKTYGARALWTF